MANCPNCGSDHIQLKPSLSVSWGRALAGYALFGLVGGAVGAVTGESKEVNCCLDCGTSWKAQDLYNVIQTLKNLTGVSLDLSRKNHRAFLNDFTLALPTKLEAITQAEKKGIELIKQTKMEAESKGVTVGFKIGCVASIIIFFLSLFLGGLFTFFGILASFLIPIVITGIQSSENEKHKEYVKQAIKNAEKKAERFKIEVEEDFKNKIMDLLDKNGL